MFLPAKRSCGLTDFGVRSADFGKGIVFLAHRSFLCEDASILCAELSGPSVSSPCGRLLRTEPSNQRRCAGDSPDAVDLPCAPKWQWKLQLSSQWKEPWRQSSILVAKAAKSLRKKMVKLATSMKKDGFRLMKTRQHCVILCPLDFHRFSTKVH